MTTLSADQEAAKVQFLKFLRDPNESVMVIKGHSGTGKTFTTNYLLRAAEAQKQLFKTIHNNEAELNVLLTASTNKAAKVIGNINNADAKTIHSTLELRVENDYKTGRTRLIKTSDFQVKKNTLLVVDEASMIDSNLLAMIHEATQNCKILYIGDPYQLTPVFDKHCPVFQQNYLTAELTTIQRQAANNPIIQVGDQLRKTVETGEFFDIPIDGTHIVKATGQELKEMIEQNYKAQSDVDDNRVLAWSNNKVNQYNKHIRELFTSSEEPEIDEVFVANSIIKSVTNRDLIVVNNDQRVRVKSFIETTYNDLDVWEITTNKNDRIYMAKNHQEFEAHLKHHRRNKDWQAFYALKEMVGDLRPPYASTVHKSQGSTYDTVYIDLADIGRCNIWQDVARMLYVGITRASNKVVLYGELPKKYRG
jgi:ATP-dependent exoDNAse (exonuclease V) alpha subunit